MLDQDMVLAENVNFKAYFDSWEVSEAGSQRWRPFHTLPADPGSGCYIFLADFDSSLEPFFFGGRKLTGMRAFYFGKAGDTENTDLYQRGSCYYHDSSGARRVNQLITALWDKGVPVVHMCAQIPTMHGKGILEAMMLEKVNFCTNSQENHGYRPKHAKSVFEDFAELCAKTQAQKIVQHSDFFSVSIGSHDQELHVDFQLAVRALTVEVQEAYAAMEAAESGLVQHQQIISEGVMKELRQVLGTAVDQLAEHSAVVDRVRDKLMKHDACKAYYQQLPPLFVPSIERAPAWTKSAKASEWQQKACDSRKASHTSQQQSSSKQGSTSTATDATRARPLYARIKEELNLKQQKAQKFQAEISDAAASGDTKSLEDYVCKITRFTFIAEQIATEVVGDVPLQKAGKRCVCKPDFIWHIAKQLVDELDGSTEEALVTAVPKKIRSKTWYDTILEDLEVKPAQADSLRNKIADAALSKNTEDLWKYLCNFKATKGRKLAEFAKQYAVEICGGEPLDFKTFQPCVFITEFVRHITWQLVSEADALTNT